MARLVNLSLHRVMAICSHYDGTGGRGGRLLRVRSLAIDETARARGQLTILTLAADAERQALIFV